MIEIFQRIGENLVDRVTGPMHFRLYLQPFMAFIFAAIAGLKDARQGNPPFFLTLFTEPDRRRHMMGEAWKDVGKVFILASVLDAVYQIVEQHFIYPFEIALVAFILAIIPYLIFRSLVKRAATLFGVKPQQH